jgi:hypothetical protein
MIIIDVPLRSIMLTISLTHVHDIQKLHKISLNFISITRIQLLINISLKYEAKSYLVLTLINHKKQDFNFSKMITEFLELRLHLYSIRAVLSF